MEWVRLRVKDVDFAYQQITVRDGKGAQDQVTILPQMLQMPLQRHLAKVQLLHEEDLQEGYGDVYLPYAFERKDPHRVPSRGLRGTEGVAAPLTQSGSRP
jgi:site-specific recombinase XerD